jgi:hypothetical protein
MTDCTFKDAPAKRESSSIRDGKGRRDKEEKDGSGVGFIHPY